MEEQIAVKPPVHADKSRKCILIILAVLLVLTVLAYVMIFHVNQFSLEVRLIGEHKIDLEYGASYEEPGADVALCGTLFWKKGITPKDAVLTVQGDVQEDTKGKYVLTYEATYKSLQASEIRTVRVVDTESPVITLVDESDETILPGMIYEEEGFAAIDNYDGDITDRVVRTEKLGMVTYSVFDSSGNPAYVEREIPCYDPLPPEIHLEQGDHITIPAGTIYEEPGFSATDNADGDVTDKVIIEGEEIIWYQPGTYQTTYSVTDSFENRTTVTRTIEVTAEPRPEIVYPGGKVIYLTFDDGPGPYTGQLLEVLRKYGIKATFFVTDSGYDSVMKDIVDQGHSIGIHSVTHTYEEIYASPEAYFRDLKGMQDIIYENTGVKTTLMRFPGGSSNLVSSFNEGIMTILAEAVQDAGFQYFDWNVDSNDAGGAKKTKTVLNNVIDGVQKERISVVLQHDIHPYSVDAVEDIILWGLENGYQFLPLQPNSPNAHHTVQN